jgi:hypothetical protein
MKDTIQKTLKTIEIGNSVLYFDKLKSGFYAIHIDERLLCTVGNRYEHAMESFRQKAKQLLEKRLDYFRLKQGCLTEAQADEMDDIVGKIDGLNAMLEDDRNKAIPYLTTAKATPGPWKYSISVTNKRIAAIRGDNKTVARTVDQLDKKNNSITTDQEAKANASIIAASPELFEACEDLVRAKDRGIEINKEAGLTCSMVEAMVRIQEILERVK